MANSILHFQEKGEIYYCAQKIIVPTLLDAIFIAKLHGTKTAKLSAVPHSALQIARFCNLVLFYIVDV